MYRAVLHFRLWGSTLPLTTLITQPYKELHHLDQVLDAFKKSRSIGILQGYRLEEYVKGPGWVVWDPTEEEYNSHVHRQAEQNNHHRGNESGEEQDQAEESH
jgi:hypothetical protein